MLDENKYLNEEETEKVVSILHQLFGKTKRAMGYLTVEDGIEIEACCIDDKIKIIFVLREFDKNKIIYDMRFDPTQEIFGEICDCFQECIKERKLETFAKGVGISDEKIKEAHEFMSKYNQVFLESSSKAFFKCVIR